MNLSHQEKLSQIKSKRLEEFKIWLQTFKLLRDQKGEEIQYINEDINEVAERLNDWYWIRRETDIVPYMQPEEEGEQVKVNHYKIISATELTIVGFQPIFHEDDSKRSLLNAKLAWFIGLTFLIGWNEMDEKKVMIALKKDRLDRFIIEHINWLTKLDIQFVYPIFSNSHTWWNFHICLDLYLSNEKPL